MEGAPQLASQESIEQLEGWRQLREEAPGKAKALMDSISNFDHMTENEKIEALDELMERLSLDNANRYIVREIGRYYEGYVAVRKLEEKLKELGLAA